MKGAGGQSAGRRAIVAAEAAPGTAIAATPREDNWSKAVWSANDTKEETFRTWSRHECRRPQSLQPKGPATVGTNKAQHAAVTLHTPIESSLQRQHESSPPMPTPWRTRTAPAAAATSPASRRRLPVCVGASRLTVTRSSHRARQSAPCPPHLRHSSRRARTRRPTTTTQAARQRQVPPISRPYSPPSPTARPKPIRAWTCWPSMWRRYAATWPPPPRRSQRCGSRITTWRRKWTSLHRRRNNLPRTLRPSKRASPRRPNHRSRRRMASHGTRYSGDWTRSRLAAPPPPSRPRVGRRHLRLGASTRPRRPTPPRRTQPSFARWRTATS